jgi:hypothetical protein
MCREEEIIENLMDKVFAEEYKNNPTFKIMWDINNKEFMAHKIFPTEPWSPKFELYKGEDLK